MAKRVGVAPKTQRKAAPKSIISLTPAAKAPGDVTRQLSAWGSGGAAEAALFDLIGSRLDVLARSVLTDANFRRKFEPPELVNETYIRLKQYLRTKRDVSFENRARFYALVLEVMRHVLIDSVRKGGKSKPKSRHVLTVGHVDVSSGHLQAIDASDFYITLDRLRQKNAKQATALELHYVVGWPLSECAELLGISTATLKRRLASAREWFEVQLRAGSLGP